MSKLLKINGLPTHGLPRLKATGDSGRNAYFSAKLYMFGIDALDKEYTDQLEVDDSKVKKYTPIFAKSAYRHPSPITADRYILIKNLKNSDGTYNEVELTEGDDIYVPSEQGLCVFKLLRDAKTSTFYIDDYPYRVIDTDFRTVVTYSFDDYAYSPTETVDNKNMQAIVLSDFNVSYTTLAYIQIYLGDNTTYLPYKYEDSETSYRTEAIKVTNDTDPITLRVPRKTTDATKTASIHIYGLYRTSANSYRRIYLGTEKIFPTS